MAAQGARAAQTARAGVRQAVDALDERCGERVERAGGVPPFRRRSGTVP
ncbi:hypothetical protein GTW43_10630 [Streptomyces sp. SID5785]|nr:hypothetical protein [Streptomyces sp. SID5785]MZD05537.1 hypothetical protein [Streptomyces sp. SID5785]